MTTASITQTFDIDTIAFTMGVYGADDIDNIPNMPSSLNKRIGEALAAHGDKIKDRLLIVHACTDKVFSGQALHVLLAQIPSPEYNPFGIRDILQSMVDADEIIEDYQLFTYSNVAPNEEFGKPLLDDVIYVGKDTLALTHLRASDVAALKSMASVLLKGLYLKAQSFAQPSY